MYKTFFLVFTILLYFYFIVPIWLSGLLHWLFTFSFT